MDVGLELLENSTATGVALAALILALGPVSGAHVNPAVSLVNRVLGGMSSREMVVYWACQLTGAALGTDPYQSDVLASGSRNLDQGTVGRRLVAGRDRCDVRPRFGHFCRCEVGAERAGCLRRGRIHRRRLLVHGLHQLCQPSGDLG
ncbi:MAG: aquaporin, partial [bacterium]